MDYKTRLEEALILLTGEKTKEILIGLGADIVTDNSELLILDTICHKGDSHKLYYYKENRSFMCYTHCGFMSAIDFFKQVWNLNFYDAVDRLRSRLGLSSRGFRKNETMGDFKDSLRESIELLNFFDKKSRNMVEIPEYNSNILKRYVDEYKEEWVMDLDCSLFTKW